MYGYQKDVAGQKLGFSLAGCCGRPITEASVSVYRSIDGGTQASATGTVTELGNGQYVLNMSQADTNGDAISFLFTATSAEPVEKTIVTVSGSSGSGGGGFPFPGFASGANYGSPFAYGEGSPGTITTSANQIYYLPFYVQNAFAFNRFYTANSGAGDNGDTYRTGIYANDGVGGPGTLILDCGEVTLTGAPAGRTQTISLDLSAYAGQWVWLAFHANQSADMKRLIAINEGATFKVFDPAEALFGTYVNAWTSPSLTRYYFRTVSSTYGAFASTAVTPDDGTSIVPVCRIGSV